MSTELGLPKARQRGATCALLVLVLSLFLTAPAWASPLRVAAIPTVNWSGYAARRHWVHRCHRDL